MSDHVSGGEFERFWEHVDKRFDRLEQRQDSERDARTEAGVGFDKRISSLETNQKQAGALSAKLSAAVSGITTAIINAGLIALGGK